MNELVFPLAGSAVVLLVLVPTFTLVARAVLQHAPVTGSVVDGHGGTWRLLLILAPALVPMLWLVSAVVHQVENAATGPVCIDHPTQVGCWDMAIFGSVLVIVVGAGIVRLVGFSPQQAHSSSPASPQVVRRVRRACEDSEQLRFLRRGVRVVRGAPVPVCTRGLVRPHVEIDEAMLAKTTDDELHAVLLHEAAHVSHGDPLRSFLARWALAINPFARLLEPALARHLFAREVMCDREAVRKGADPLALASAIVRVAAPQPLPFAAAGLGSHAVEQVRVRVQLLLAHVGFEPRRTTNGRLGLTALSGFIAAIVLSPHVAGTAPLTVLHHAVEHAALFLLTN